MERCRMIRLATGWWSEPPAIVRYALAALLVGVALVGARWMEANFVGAPVSLFSGAVLLSGWFGGFGPGIFAAALAAVGFEYEFLIPLHSLSIAPNELPRFAVFSTFILLLALLSGAQHKITQSLRRARDELDGAVRKLTQTNAALRLENAERERVESELRDSEQRFRDFAETGSDWLWETGPDHRFTHTSEHLKTAGIEPQTHIGQTRWEFGSDLENEAEKWTAHVAAHELREPFRDFVYRLRRPDGSTMYVKTSGRPVFDDQGKFLGYRGIGSDITAEVQGREAERALRQAQTELAHVTRVTTVGELTASIVHEVNQPLAAIATNGEAALRFLHRAEPDLQEVHDAITGMISDSRRASDVIQRVRALCRKSDLQLVRLDVNELIDDSLLLMQREVRDHRVSLRRDLALGLPPVRGDRVQLQQVIINLVMNAMEAMASINDRPRDLTIRSWRDADQVLVAVEDSGTGIDPDRIDHLFGSFYTTKPGGLGMGLSICRSIIEAHGGKLWASSNAGPGATFQFSLQSVPASKERT
jgi:PAS domain S-box-containing protein